MNKIIFPLKSGMEGASVADLQDALAAAIDHKAFLAGNAAQAQQALAALKPERTQSLYGATTAKLVGMFQTEQHLQSTSAVDQPTAAALNALIAQWDTPSPDPQPSSAGITYRVEGRVASRVSVSLGSLRVVIVDKGVGEDTPLTEATTDAGGKYLASFSKDALTRRGKEKPDLQARVFLGQQFLAASEVRYNASEQEKDLNVFLDGKASANLGSEYETLLGALSLHYKGRLGDLQETDERQDITYLANKSGWDARAVALAALSDQFTAKAAAADANVRIEPPFFYALFRAGVPANEATLYRTDPKTVETIWKQALQQGVIPSKLSDTLPAAIAQFERSAGQQLMKGPPLAGVSSLNELLESSVSDSDKRRKIADLYTLNRNDTAKFWQDAKAAVGEATTARLMLDGQLAYLTLNNVPLIGKLHATAGGVGLQDPVQLVAQGFHRSDKWRAAIGSDSIPPEVAGKDDAEKRAHYADLLAAQVRLTFPTATVAEMVKADETPVSSAAVKNDVHTFLSQNEGKFVIGMQPVAQYVARNNLQVAPAVTQEISRIQRVYQITPDDQSMNGLLKSNIDSAHAVMRYERDEFVRAFKDNVGGEENARLIHAKAAQVHTAVLNVALSFLTAKSAPGIGVHSPASIVSPGPTPPANASDVLAYGKLETLFGEMDYCACDHCKSILSPAAYLVDLLLYLDRPASEIPTGFTNPQAVLLDRRPDIQHLPLTCENTNTPLPYIDLVNETLEYFITNGLALGDTDPNPAVNSEYTGHNTDSSAIPEDLLANPQFVSDAAYTTLAGANFPPPLPFHQALESLRRYLNRFEAPLPEVMEALRKNDSLDRASVAEYAWRDIWMETVGLSRAEHWLLTERWLTGAATDVMLTVKQLYGFDPATADSDVRAVLDNAKAFSRRAGLTYDELADILQTRFINPNSYLIPKLQRLGVPFATLKALKDGTIADADFDALLAPGLDASQFGGDVKAWVRDNANFGRIMSLLTLTNPADAEDICNFDEVELRYSNPDSAANQLRPFEFVRLARFIRLWKKLGWSIEQTDQVISALYPTAQTPNDPADAVNLERLDAGFLSVIPSLGILRRVMGTLNLSLPKDLSALLACVAPIDTYGERSFFRQMFLGPSQLDSAFADDGYGNYFSDTTQKVLGHAPALRAAFSLTASEFNEIAAALAYDANTTLTLDNITAIFRRGWLARKLKLSVREFLLLVKYTGYDPFGVPTAVSPAILRFIEFITRLRSLRIKPVEALFLIWNQDLSGKSAPAKTEITGFARSLRASLAAIEGEFARADDPDGSIARSRMALVYGNDATDLFFGLLENTFLTFVTYSDNEAELAQPIRDAGEGRISYDDFRKRLTFAGVLSTAIVGALKAVPGVTQDFKDAVDKLYTENQKVIGPFFDRYPELLPLHDAYVASADPVEKKRTALLDAFLPELKHRRKRQQALQSTSAEVETDIGLASSVLENPAVLHASADPTGQALDDFSGIESPGFSARYFFGASTTGNADLTRVAEALLDYAASSGNPLPGNATTPGTPISGIWSGYLEVPENGFYNIRVDTDAVTTVTLTINSAVIPLTKWGNSWSNSAPLEFAAGLLYEISLTAVKVKDKLSVRWQTSGRGWEVIPAPYLYSATLINNLQRAYVNLLKAAGLAKSLKLTAFEFEQFAAAADYQIGGEGWVNRLPIDGAPDSGTSAGLLKAYVALLDFSRIKAEVSPGDERLVLVLKNPAAATVDGGLLYVLTRWEKPSLDALLVRFGKTAADLAHMETLRRIYDAYAWAQKLGVPTDALMEAAMNEPTAQVVRHLQSALRARYETSAWLEVLRPINDALRSLQRDALVSYVLHRMRSNPASAQIDTPDKLFEYFLMDVQMDPCMLTSRIRHALSSVQLFVERCLMGLEPRVSPASIKTKQWEWMKRYRVWEANRKVFIWPENWLEPELRDDQSPFFKETMSELLQGDITEDKAAAALVGYLTKLEEVAKLEVCGVHYEQNGTGTSDDIAHVIGRTAGAKRRYYYRRREYGYWTSWEKINLDIEDNPVLPVVWKKRLFLFWLKLVQETIKDAPPVPTGSLANVDAGTAFPKNKPRVAVKAILTWSEFLGGKWQPSRTSDPGKPLPLFDEDWIPGMDPSEVTAYRSDLRLAALFWPSGSDPQGALRLIVSYKGWKGSSFFLYNPFSSPELRESKKEPHFSPKRSLDATTSLTVGYSDRSVTQNVLDNGIANSAIDPHHPLEGNSWEAPFFYQDARHAFYVTTDEQLVSVRHWNDLGIVVRDPKAVYALPLLVHKLDDVLVQPVPHSRQPGFGLVDPIPLERYVTEDAYVGTAIGSPGTVAYGDKNIGPSGSEYKIIQRTSVERKR